MLDPKQRAEIDQANATLKEMLPPLWWALYKGCLKEGFTEYQAMSIVIAYVSAQAKVEG